MNERLKILELLAAGKITAEQADDLIAAIDERTARTGHSRNADKFRIADFKNIGSQISTAVTQSLGEVRRVIEQQVDNWSAGLGNNTLSVTHDIQLPLTVLTLSAETSNGRIQVSAWDEPFVRVHIRAHMRANSVSDARQALQAAVQLETDVDRCDLVVPNGYRDPKANAVLHGAHIDLYVPKHMKQLTLRSQNGGIFTENVQLEQLHADTVNGSIAIYSTEGQRIHANTENGRIELRDSISARTQEVYVFTKNGTLTIEGVPTEMRLTGTARTSHGRIDIARSLVDSDSSEDPGRRTFVRFRGGTEGGAAGEVRLQLETKNGAIRMRE